MQSFTDAALDKITTGPRPEIPLRPRHRSGRQRPYPLSERLHHLTATSTPPFGNQDTLIETLVYIWTAVLYRT
jgi:hypothetical protein